jgi:hypothetical protein
MWERSVRPTPAGTARNPRGPSTSHEGLPLYSLLFISHSFCLRNLWVTDTVEWCREARLAHPTGPAMWAPLSRCIPGIARPFETAARASLELQDGLSLRLDVDHGTG